MKTNYLCGLFLLCVLVWGRSEAHAEKPLKTLDLYLCIGQSNMAGRGKLSPDGVGILVAGRGRLVIFLTAESERDADDDRHCHDDGNQ